MTKINFTQLESIPYHNEQESTYEIPIHTIEGVSASLMVPPDSQIAEMHRLDPASVSVGTRTCDPTRKYPNFISQNEPTSCLTIQSGRVTHYRAELPAKDFNKPL